MTKIVKIVAMRPNGEEVAVFDSPMDAVMKLGLKPWCAKKRIYDCLCYKNQNDYAYGYCWGFKDIEVED